MRILVKFGLIIGLPILLIIGLIIGMGFFLSPQDKLQHADVIVAISGGETTQRTVEAIKLYNEGYGSKLLFSGAAADHNGPSNAAAMESIAVSMGVPISDILIEEDSATTSENASKVAPILNQVHATSIILVTSPYHQRRASIVFHRALGDGIAVYNHSSKDSTWRKSSWWTKPYDIYLSLSELQKIIYVWSTKSDKPSSTQTY